MQVEISKLRKVLERIKLGCGDGSIVEWLGHVAFREGTATVWNSVFGIIHKEALEGEFSVNYDRLFSILKSFKNVDATCTIADNKLTLKTAKQTATILASSIEDFTFPKIEKVIEKPLDDSFRGALEIVSNAIPKSMKGYSNFNGVSFGVTTVNNHSFTRMLAYDGHKYAFIKFTYGAEPFIIHTKVVDAIQKLGNPRGYGIGNQFIYFFYDDIIIFTRPLDVKESHLPSFFWIPVCELREIDDTVRDFAKNASAIGAETIVYSRDNKTMTAVEKHGDNVILEIDLGEFQRFTVDTEDFNDSLYYAKRWGIMEKDNAVVLVFEPLLEGYLYLSGMREA